MRVALGRLDGVESVTVSLEEGIAVIRLADENEVSVSAIRRVVRDNGFSPKQTAVRGVFETVALPDGKIGIKIGDEAYLLEFPFSTDVDEEREALPGGIRVQASGVIVEPQEGSKPRFEAKEILRLQGSSDQ